jgi:hypothetical protein
VCLLALGSSDRLAVVPGHPLGRIALYLSSMFLQFRQVVEGIRFCQLGGVNEAHEDIADMSALSGLIKVAVLPAQNSPFQNSFSSVVIQRGSDIRLPREGSLRHGSIRRLSFFISEGISTGVGEFFDSIGCPPDANAPTARQYQKASRGITHAYRKDTVQ